MLEHRFREHLTADVGVATLPSPAAFVPCPVLAAYNPAQLACVAEVYRLAQEQTRAQMQQARRVFPPVFSLN